MKWIDVAGWGVVAGVVGVAAIPFVLIHREEARAETCQRRYAYTEAIRPDISAHDAAVLATAIDEARHGRPWCEMPGWVKEIIIDNTTDKQRE